MHTPTQALPANYFLVHEIDLSKDKPLALTLNILALLILLPTLLLLLVLATWLRPELTSGSFQFHVDFTALLFVFGALALIVFILVAHEGIHGALFWAFTRARPSFGLQLAFAYASAPDWYIPAWHYIVIALAPLFLLGGFGVLLLAIVPPGWIFPLALAIAFNTGGSIGDVYIVHRLLGCAPGCLANDHGGCVRFYQAEEHTHV